MPLNLAQLFNHYGSDKDRNGYTPLYHTLFNHIRDQPIQMLEIGIGTMIPGVHSSMVGYSLPGYKPGGSLRAWRDYFPNGRIIGMDVQPDTIFSDEPRIETYLCDSRNKQAVDVYMTFLQQPKFDIIIDDGSHAADSQLRTLENFYPHLKDGGIYIIEDIFPGSAISEQPELLQAITGGDPQFFVGYKNNQCVIFKHSLRVSEDSL